MEMLMTPAERTFFHSCVSTLPHDGRVSEWGSGGSTLFIAEKMSGGQKLVSFEHSKKWWERVSFELEFAPAPVASRVSYHHIPTEMPYALGIDRDEGDTKAYTYSLPLEELPAYNAKYIDPEKSRRVNCFDSDVYFVDGISRGAVLATVFAKARNREALVLLHDYTGREGWYEWAASLYPRVERGPDNFLVLRMK